MSRKDEHVATVKSRAKDFAYRVVVNNLRYSPVSAITRHVRDCAADEAQYALGESWRRLLPSVKSMLQQVAENAALEEMNRVLAAHGKPIRKESEG